MTEESTDDLKRRVAEHDDTKCVRSVGDCEDCAAIAANSALAKAREILDVAVSSDTAYGNMPAMVDAARAYMELSDRYL